MGTELLVKDLKKLLWLFFWASFCFWMVLWILLPTATGEKLVLRAQQRAPSFISDFGATLILYSAPVIGFSIFSLLFLHLERTYPEERSSSGRLKRLHNLMWTQPLLTRGPLGVATGFDVLAATVTLAAVTWIFFKTLASEENAGSRSLKYLGAAFSRAALLPLSLLCFPVSRGSPLLRMIGLPFQPAVKYHRWLGHLTLTLYCTHSVLFICVFIIEHGASKMLRWPVTGISYVAGTIAFAAGIVIWITSVAPIRRNWFEFFYATHHLYLVFFTFLVLHVGAKASAHAAGGVFLFFIDRFIRLVQARHGLSLAATKVYSSGVVELKLRKSPGVYSTPLSSVFVNIPCVSRLEWHPFSVTSSARDCSQTLTLCIKPRGEWTTRLRRAIVASDSKATPSSCVFSNALFAEGPYGYGSEFFLRYDALVLVAGGIGITPFIAVLRDLFHRCQTNERRLPKSVQIIWSVKRGSELVLLTDVFPATRFSTTAVHLECHAFVTGRDSPGKNSSLMQENETMAMDFPNVSGCEGSLSSVAATGNGLWIASLISVAAIATILVMYVFDRFTSPVSVALLFFGSTLAGIAGFGGIVMFAWSISRNSGKHSKSIITSVYEKEDSTSVRFPLPDRENVWQRNLLDKTRVMRGRPNIRSKCQLPLGHVCFSRHISELVVDAECFDAAADCYRGKEVGVLVCGPESLRRSVATECKYHYMSSSAKSPFYFHSLSFDI